MLELSHPIDIGRVLRKKRSIKKDLLKSENLIDKKIAILGGSTTAELRDFLELFLLNIGIRPKFYESDYGRYYEDAVFGNEALDQFNPDICYIHTSIVNIHNFPKLTDSSDDVVAKLGATAARFEEIWNSLSKFGCTIIQNNFELPQHRPLGNLDSYDERGRSHFVGELNRSFANAARKNKNLMISDINFLSAQIGHSTWFDKRLWYQAKYCVGMSAMVELASNISKIIAASLGMTKKCLVLDLDNTCWGGVIGDDGVHGIEIGQGTPLGEAHLEFQNYVCDLSDRGIALAISSKNDHETALEGIKHPESQFKESDFASTKANWNPKHENIQEIADEISLNTDSMVFIDDNPVERELVSSQLPEVEVPNIGEDITHFIDHIDRAGYFEPVSISTDDIKRREFYSSNKLRQESAKKFKSYSDFLASLEMKAEIAPFTPIHVERLTQLCNKTNQFNLTGRRYTRSDVESITQDSEHIAIYGKLADRHGDNGLVTAIVGKVENNKCYIEDWVMSCRVLKRSMEFAMFNEFARRALELGVSEIIGKYKKTAKNGQVEGLYSELGFSESSSNDDLSLWSLELAQHKELSTQIEVNNE